MKVLKFGGTSLAEPEVISKAVDIIKAEPAAAIVVVSAPGKRFAADQKLTDLLYAWFKQYTAFKQGVDLNAEYKYTKRHIKKRFADIVKGLKLEFDLDGEFEKIERDIKAGAGVDYMASRGEYLMAKIMAKLLGASHIEAADVFRFKGKTFDQETSLKRILKAVKKKGLCVMGGFYGATSTGEIVTFSRGGSDLSGAVAARAIGATVYENWTDVEGFFAASPQIIKEPKKIYYVSYSDMHKMAFYGAQVLHKDSVSPLCEAGIPINIKSVFSARGTGTIVGDASEKGFISVTSQKGFNLVKLNADISGAVKIFDDAEFAVKMPTNVMVLTKKSGGAEGEKIPGISRIAVVGDIKPQRITAIIKATQSVTDIIFMGFEQRVLVLGISDDFCEKTIATIYKVLFEGS